MKVKTDPNGSSDPIAAGSDEPATLAEPEKVSEGGGGVARRGVATGCDHVAEVTEADTGGGLITGERTVVGVSGSANVVTKDGGDPSPESYPIFKETTPSGLVVEYQPEPKRLYRVDGVEVPSVTTVLGVLDKPALSWWGMRVGIQGVLELLSRKVIYGDVRSLATRLVDEAWGSINAADIEKFLTEQKLTVNHVVKEASDRGLSVHDAFETWAKTGHKPFAPDFPETEIGYIDGLNKFLADVDPEPLAAEVMVGSREHGFAGRYDIRFRLNKPVEAVTKCYPKRDDVRGEIPAGTFLGDLKTSKSTYSSHHLQLSAYELASLESGYEETDGQWVIHVTGDGKYELVKSKAFPEQFLTVREVFDVMQELK